MRELALPVVAVGCLPKDSMSNIFAVIFLILRTRCLPDTTFRTIRHLLICDAPRFKRPLMMSCILEL